MKQYLPLLGIFLLFFLVISGFAHGQSKGAPQSLTSAGAVNTQLAAPLPTDFFLLP